MEGEGDGSWVIGRWRVSTSKTSRQMKMKRAVSQFYYKKYS